ncbi:MAG: hypothetical protein WCO05_03020 [Candidatus Moraniibacteriota bacterium]
MKNNFVVLGDEQGVLSVLSVGTRSNEDSIEFFQTEGINKKLIKFFSIDSDGQDQELGLALESFLVTMHHVLMQKALEHVMTIVANLVAEK